jgi:hypothetical protein
MKLLLSIDKKTGSVSESYNISIAFDFSQCVHISVVAYPEHPKTKKITEEKN